MGSNAPQSLNLSSPLGGCGGRKSLAVSLAGLSASPALPWPVLFLTGSLSGGNGGSSTSSPSYFSFLDVQVVSALASEYKIEILIWHELLLCYTVEFLRR